VSVPDAAAVPGSATRNSRYWIVFLLRAVVALVVGFTITFSANHSTLVGYIAFGAFALVSGLVAIFATTRLERGIERTLAFVQAALGIVAGVVALLLTGGGVSFLLFLVSAWAVISGFLEIYTGIRARRNRSEGRDWLFAGILTAIFAIIVLLIPASFDDRYTGPDGVARSITASVLLVGFFGAYAAILGVYTAIAAFSLKWGTQRAALRVAESSN